MDSYLPLVVTALLVSEELSSLELSAAEESSALLVFSLEALLSELLGSLLLFLSLESPPQAARDRTMATAMTAARSRRRFFFMLITFLK